MIVIDSKTGEYSGKIILQFYLLKENESFWTIRN